MRKAWVTAVAILAAGCGDLSHRHFLGGKVTGLAGTGLVLQNSGGDDLGIDPPGGEFTFHTTVAEGARYEVTVKSQPTSPVQTCAVSQGAGTVGKGRVTDVLVQCATASHLVGGTVSGLVGAGLVLQNNQGDDLSVSPPGGAFTFVTSVAEGADYGVTVSRQPTSPAQTCNVEPATAEGRMGGADVTSVVVSCLPPDTPAHSIGGTINGLMGTGLVLQNNEGDALAVDARAGKFTFQSPIAEGTPYSVTVRQQPYAPAQVCAVDPATAAGTMGGSDIASVVVNCRSTDLYFFATAPGRGYLWRSDGTSEGTVPIPAEGLLDGGNPTACNDVLYFAGWDGSTYRLWKTDGATATTVHPEIELARDQDYPLVCNGGELFFWGVTSEGRRYTLWRLDVATEAAGEVLHQYYDAPLPFLAAFNDEIYYGTFSVCVPVEGTGCGSPPNTYTEFLWRTDGTSRPADLVALFEFLSGEFVAFDGALYFGGAPDAPDTGDGHSELWKIEVDAATHSAGAPVLVSSTTQPRGFTVFAGALYFSATDGVHGEELWKFDGASEPEVVDINPGEGSSSPAGFNAFDGALYFSATVGAGSQLWRTDGNVTESVDAEAGVSFPPQELTVLDGALYFRTDAGIDGQGGILWRYDGGRIESLRTFGAGSVPAELTALGGALYFRACENDDCELWRTRDGTTGVFADLNSAGSSGPRGFFVR
jgi:ELWxxDGT repeat protein